MLWWVTCDLEVFNIFTKRLFYYNDSTLFYSMTTPIKIKKRLAPFYLTYSLHASWLPYGILHGQAPDYLIFCEYVLMVKFDLLLFSTFENFKWCNENDMLLMLRSELYL